MITVDKRGNDLLATLIDAYLKYTGIDGLKLVDTIRAEYKMITENSPVEVNPTVVTDPAGNIDINKYKK